MFKQNLTNSKIEKNNLKENLWTFQKRINKKLDLKVLEDLKIEVKNLNLKILIGTENAGITAVLVGIVSSIFPILLKKYFKENNNHWEIIPIYQNEKLLKINLNCIISLKLIHIIYTLFKLKNKEGKKVEK